jgi:hypothetical protein
MKMDACMARILYTEFQKENAENMLRNICKFVYKKVEIQTI